jgi:hypothetical protein
VYVCVHIQYGLSGSKCRNKEHDNNNIGIKNEL